MATEVMGGNSYKNLSASGQVKGSGGVLSGLFAASSSSGTAKVWDSTAGSGKVLVNTFSLIDGTWYPLPFAFGTGCYVTIGGTADVTVSYS